VQYGLAWIKNNPLDEGADYVFNRLLVRHNLAVVDWKEISDIALTWLRAHSSKRNRDLSLAALLVRPEQLKQQDLDWVVRQAEQWLTDPPETAHAPDRLLTALRYLRRKQDLARTANNPGWIQATVMEKLNLAARRQVGLPSPGEIEEVMNSMAAALATSRPGQAAYPLPSLLAIVQPAVHVELWRKLIELARSILAHPQFLPHHREGLSRTMWLLIDRGVWPEGSARPVLEDLNLLRPSTEQSTSR
jgi:hypothetical protein